jgi:hypothetical protein
MAYEVFICYRRKDSAGYAGRLHEHLKTEYGVEGVLFETGYERNSVAATTCRCSSISSDHPAGI